MLDGEKKRVSLSQSVQWDSLFPTEMQYVWLMNLEICILEADKQPLSNLTRSLKPTIELLLKQQTKVMPVFVKGTKQSTEEALFMAWGSFNMVML